MISETTLKQIQERLDAVQWIGRYVTLKKRGQNYLGLCPFHPEKSPSFTVSPSKQIWHCFGCQKGGNIFQFTMQIDNVSFVEAAKTLAEAAGIELEIDQHDAQLKDARQRLWDVLTFAQNQFRAWLANSEAESYVYQQRRLSAAAVEQFGVGYGGAGWDALSQAFVKASLGSPQVLVEAGLCMERAEGNGLLDRFRQRVIFPIRDVRGRVIAFGGRALSAQDQAKYINSPETIVYDKSANLYGLFEAQQSLKKEQYAVLVEGYLDVVSCHSSGVTMAVASLGTALTERQVSLIKRYVPEVLLCYDNDSAGREATLRAGQMLRKQDVRVKVVDIQGLDSKDADDVVQKHGPEVLRQQVQQAKDFYEFMLRSFLAEFNLDDSNQRSTLVRRYAELLQQDPDPVRIDFFLREAAKLTGIDLEIWKSLGKPLHRSDLLKPRAASTAKGLPKPELEAERGLVMYLAEHVEHRSKLNTMLQPDDFSDVQWQAAATFFWSSHLGVDALERLNPAPEWLGALRSGLLQHHGEHDHAVPDYIRLLKERKIQRLIDDLTDRLRKKPSTDQEPVLNRELAALVQEKQQLKRTILAQWTASSHG